MSQSNRELDNHEQLNRMLLVSQIKPEIQTLRQGIKEKSASSSKQEIKAK